MKLKKLKNNVNKANEFLFKPNNKKYYLNNQEIMNVVLVLIWKSIDYFARLLGTLAISDSCLGPIFNS